MPREFQLQDVAIVGYSGALSPEFVPRVVPPIFATTADPEVVIMPPYQLIGDRVTEISPGHREDLERAVRRGQVTMLEARIAARPDHRLWIDEDFRPQYGPADLVDRELREKARHYVRRAQSALGRGYLDETLRLTQAAISADARCLNAILLKACVYRIRNEPGKIKILSRIAEQIAPGTDLISWVDLYSDLYNGRSGTILAGDGWLGVGGESSQEFDSVSMTEIAEQLVARYRLLTLIAASRQRSLALAVTAGVP